MGEGTFFIFIGLKGHLLHCVKLCIPALKGDFIYQNKNFTYHNIYHTASKIINLNQVNALLRNPSFCVNFKFCVVNLRALKVSDNIAGVKSVGITKIMVNRESKAVMNINVR